MRVGSVLDLAHLPATPANPVAGASRVYAKSDDILRVLTSAGAEKMVPCPQFVRKTADQGFTATTLADVTGLSFAVKSGVRYQFEFRGALTAAAGTTGLALAVNGPTLGADGLLANTYISVNAGSIVQGTTTAYNTAVIGTGSLTATLLPWSVTGFLHAGADGTFTLRAATEVAASTATVKLNSYAFLWTVG